jgi:hypothetical protein
LLWREETCVLTGVEGKEALVQAKVFQGRNAEACACVLGMVRCGSVGHARRGGGL